MTENNNSAALKIIPLGGLHEIGKNTCVFEYGDEIILVDAGLAFPSDDMHGVNIVLPDMTYLKDNRHKIKGMIVTHGHEDHIGGIAYHLKQFDVPVIYGPKLALTLLHDKLEEAGMLKRTTIKHVKPRDVVRLGRSFAVEFIRNTHSIADSFSIAITTPIGVIIMTGDFKIDHTPVDKEYFDLHRIAEYGAKGVLCLLSDSTNAELPGYTPSEASVYPNLDRIFSQAKGRIMLTTFATSVHRVNIVLSLAIKHGRKVAVVGRSMLNVIAHARNLGYIKCPDDLFTPIKSIRNLPDEKIIILTTGSQGETLSAMTRISKGEHGLVKVRHGDTVVFSASPIPGNTIAVVNTIDRLMMLGAHVVYGKDKGIHVSGHGSQEEHKLMLALTKPKFFMPVHGEHRMLVKHAEMAHNMGIPTENIVIVKNGDVVSLSPDKIAVIDQVTSGIELVDNSGIIRESVMKERQHLAQDGVLSVAAAIDGDGKLLAPTDVHIRGMVTTIERPLLQQLISRAIDRIITEKWDNYRQRENGENSIQWSRLEADLEDAVRFLVKRELQSEPLVVLMLQHPQEEQLIRRLPQSSPSSHLPIPIDKTYKRRRPTAILDGVKKL